MFTLQLALVYIYNVYTVAASEPSLFVCIGMPAAGPTSHGGGHTDTGAYDKRAKRYC